MPLLAVLFGDKLKGIDWKIVKREGFEGVC